MGRIIKLISNWRKPEVESKQFDSGGLKSISLEEAIKGINLPDAKNHKIEYNSVIEIEPPKSNSPEHISEFLRHTFREDYRASEPQIKHVIETRGQKPTLQKYIINAKYLNAFRMVKNFSATVSFEYD
jgi:hypothetical protein